jgi:hypothetical protein
MSVGVAAVGVLCSEAKLADARGRGSPFLRHLHPHEDVDFASERVLHSARRASSYTPQAVQ